VETGIFAFNILTCVHVCTFYCGTCSLIRTFWLLEQTYIQNTKYKKWSHL